MHLLRPNRRQLLIDRTEESLPVPLLVTRSRADRTLLESHFILAGCDFVLRRGIDLLSRWVLTDEASNNHRCLSLREMAAK